MMKKNDEKEWYEEFGKIKKLLADAEEGRIERINNLKRELVHERYNLIGELNEVQRRINNINEIIRFMGVKEMEEEEYYTEEGLDDIVSDHEALKEYLYGWKDAIKDGRLYKKKYVDQYKNR